MPAGDVTVSAEFEEKLVYTATLAHTNDGKWGKVADGLTSGGLDAEAQCYAYERTNDNYVGGATYIQFTDIPTDLDIGSAILTVSGNQWGNYPRDMKVYWLPDNPDLTTVSNDAAYTGTKTQTAKLLNTKNKGEFTDASVEIKDAVRAMASTGTLTLYITENIALVH